MIGLIKCNDAMTNSFYYFFSATPQVLAAILALFGVFVIFKIRSLKSELIGIGKSLISNTTNYNDQSDSLISIQIKVNANLALQNNDIEKLKSTFDIFTNKVNYHYQKFYKVYNSLQSLIKRTIFWSKITVVLIIICLSTIPFGDMILNNVYIFYSLFISVIGCLMFIFINLISILKEALSDSD
jgi:hypothetical protein